MEQYFDSSDINDDDELIVQIKVKALETWSGSVDVLFTDADGEDHRIAVRYEDIIRRAGEHSVFQENGQTFKDPRVLIFESFADVFSGQGAAREAIDEAKRRTTEDKQTRTVLVVPAQCIDNALSFVDMGVRQVRHSELTGND